MNSRISCYKHSASFSDVDIFKMVNVRRFLQVLAISSVSGAFLTSGSSLLANSRVTAEMRASNITLSKLYERLAQASDDLQAREIEAAIMRQWLHSGSAMADLLLMRAHIALEMDDSALAVELLDRVVVLLPDWAEAYARRGQIFMVLGDNERAVADFHQVLIRDDKHYVALESLAALFEHEGARQGALKLYERAKIINPHLEGAEMAIERLRIAVDGRSL